MFATICVHTTSACKRAGMVQPSNLLSAGGQAQSLATRNRHALARRVNCCLHVVMSVGRRVGWGGSGIITLEVMKELSRTSSKCVCVCVRAVLMRAGPEAQLFF